MGTLRQMKYTEPSTKTKRAEHMVACPKIEGGAVLVQSRSKRNTSSAAGTCHACPSFERQGGMFIECGYVR